MTDKGNGFFAWGGNLYRSDIVRACIRPKAKAIGKLVGKHIRETITAEGKQLSVNSEPYLRFLLEEPNPLMTAQVMQEKLATQLMLNNNAFAVILRDDNGYPTAIYPLPAYGVEAKYADSGELYLIFTLQNGRLVRYWYRDIIHLRHDFNDNDIFGDSPAPAIVQLMDVITTTDQSIVNTIKKSAVIQWLIKFTQPMRPEDVKERTEEIADTYLSTASNKTGIIGIDNKVDAEQIKPYDYVPNALQMDRTTQRIYAFFNTNQNIVQAKYTEDEWNSYYESEVEPDAIQLGQEYTRKLFTRRERGFGNRIMFEAANLQCASISTKLNLLQMVDRGAMTPNEWRSVFNLAPVPGGDTPIRRLDTQPTTAPPAESTEGVEGGEDE